MQKADKSRVGGMIYTKKKVRKLAKKALNAFDFSDRGYSGCYYSRIKDKIGCKVFHNGYDTKKELLDSYSWEAATKEYNMIKRLEYSNMTPKAYSVEAFRLGKEWWAVIIMEHIVGPTLHYFDKQGDCAIEYIFNKFRRITGYDYFDDHQNNVVVHINDKYPTGYKYYVIDLDPRRMTKVGKRK